MDESDRRRPPSQIALAERWRVAGALMRRNDPRKYLHHLLAMEDELGVEPDVEPAVNPADRLLI